MQVKPQLGNRIITRLSVQRLFGDFNYDLRLRDDAASNLIALYGDNGAGKSTILQLTYHLLDPDPAKGHRTYISRIPFESFEVQFADDANVYARRPTDSLTGSFEMGITLPNGASFTHEYAAAPGGNIPRPETVEAIEKQRDFLNHLELAVPTVHWLPEDRKHKIIAEDDPARLSLDEYMRRRNEHQRTAMDDTLARLYGSIQGRALEASNAGVAHVNTVYARIARDLASPIERADEDGVDLGELIEALEAETHRSDAFARYGLISSGGLADVLTALKIADHGRAQILARVIRPFLDGLKARLDALQDVYDTIRTLLDSLEQFYKYKRVGYSLSDGLSIHTRSGSRLQVGQLSSGEQQLLLLLSDIAAAQDRSSLFIIDEPELSLNITWQRDLIDAFRGFARSGRTQFLLATHSLELISRYRDNVVSL